MAYQPPMNVRAPMDRRKALVNKLFQQYQAGRAGAGGGTPFRSVTQMPHGPQTQMTGNNNVAAAVQAALGSGGYGTPLAGDASASAGAPVSLPSPVSLPPQAVTPLATPPGGQPPVTPPTSAIAAAQSAISSPQSAPLVNAWESQAMLPADAVPLGGGTYYSPTQGYISPGSSPADQLGGSAGTIGGTIGGTGSAF